MSEFRCRGEPIRFEYAVGVFSDSELFVFSTRGERIESCPGSEAGRDLAEEHELQREAEMEQDLEMYRELANCGTCGGTT